MSIDVITLGKEGLLKDTDLKIDYLMCCYFFSKYSQSTLYQGNVRSLTKIIQMYGDDETTIRTRLQDDLQSFLSKYFTTASVEVTLDTTNSTDPDIKLIIAAIVSDGNSISPNSSSVGYSLLTKNSQLKSIINLSNGDDLLNKAA